MAILRSYTRTKHYWFSPSVFPRTVTYHNIPTLRCNRWWRRSSCTRRSRTRTSSSTSGAIWGGRMYVRNVALAHAMGECWDLCKFLKTSPNHTTCRSARTSSSSSWSTCPEARWARCWGELIILETSNSCTQCKMIDNLIYWESSPSTPRNNNCRNKWGPMNEPATVLYATQILHGLK